MNPFHDISFWAGLFSFLGSLIASSKWLIRGYFVSKQKSAQLQAHLDMGLEKFKATEAGKFMVILKESVDQIIPVMESHSKLIADHTSMVATLERSVKTMSLAQEEMREMMKTLKIQYDNFQSRMNSVTVGGEMVMEKLKGIETEVLHLKSGNIFIKTKT